MLWQRIVIGLGTVKLDSSVASFGMKPTAKEELNIEIYNA